MALPWSDADDLCELRSRRGTCVVDGDTGWKDGEKWRLLSIDAPELHHAECPNELALAFRAADRLIELMIELMSDGYQLRQSGRMDIYSRSLVTVRLRDGRDAGKVLVGEGQPLAQSLHSLAHEYLIGRRHNLSLSVYFAQRKIHRREPAAPYGVISTKRQD